jgi:uncharacterized protein (TIGR02453 family)
MARSFRSSVQPEPLRSFPGIRAAGIKFLKDLKENNDREWFRERKGTFERELQQPMAALAELTTEACLGQGLPLRATLRSPVSRIYRDIRFSKDKSPFYDFVSTGLFREAEKLCPGVLYIHVGSDEAFAASAFWRPERPLLNAWRGDMAGTPERFSRVLKALERAGHTLENSEPLTRLPRGFEAQADSTLASYFRLTSFIVRRPLSHADLRNSGLPSELAKFAVSTRPLLDFGWSLINFHELTLLAEQKKARNKSER